MLPPVPSASERVTVILSEVRLIAVVNRMRRSFPKATKYRQGDDRDADALKCEVGTAADVRRC